MNCWHCFRIIDTTAVITDRIGRKYCSVTCLDQEEYDRICKVRDEEQREEE